MADLVDHTVPPAAPWAGKVIGFEPPLLRIRYPHGVYVTLAGYVDWLPYTRAMLDLPPPDQRVSAAQQRVADVLTANLAMADDPLWRDEPPGATPDGWLWRHLPGTRRLGLIPAEAAVAFRHAGGLAVSPHPDSTGPGDQPGLDQPGAAVGFKSADPVPAEDIAVLERDLPGPLPQPYREFLTSHGAARPRQPAVLPGFGFVIDQSLLRVGQGRKHLLDSVGYQRKWWGDRFTGDLLAVARVQGGLLALRLTGPDAGSVWFWDADDPRDDARYDAPVVTRDLLRRCADSFGGLLGALVPALDAARTAGASGRAVPVREPGMGASLLVRDRPPV